MFCTLIAIRAIIETVADYFIFVSSKRLCLGEVKFMFLCRNNLILTFFSYEFFPVPTILLRIQKIFVQHSVTLSLPIETLHYTLVLFFFIFF